VHWILNISPKEPRNFVRKCSSTVELLIYIDNKIVVSISLISAVIVPDRRLLIGVMHLPIVHVRPSTC